MVRLPVFLLITTLLSTVSFFTQSIVGQPNSSTNGVETLSAGYYVVVGAYSPRKEYYAKRYVDHLAKLGHQAEYGYSTKKKLLMVYLMSSDYFKDAITEMRKTRKIDEFHDAWVFVITDIGTGNQTKKSNGAETQDKTKTFNRIDESNPSQQNEQVVEKKGVEKNEDGTDTSKETSETLDQSEQVGEAEVQDVKTTSDGKGAITSGTNTLNGASILFRLSNARNFEEVNGEVQIIDTERSKFLTTVKSGKEVSLKDPENGTGDLTLICDVFGFRKSQIELSYNDPLADTFNVAKIDGTYVVGFDLVRYHKGDIVTMFNVYFYKDASLMRPESKFEIRSLLDMMEENKNLKIKIHGHVNGKHPGKIISQGESTNFFALSEGNKEGFGTAKELSAQRAELIRDYLVSKGITKDRMEIKAWGGKRMLHDKHSRRAKTNVRVEIEILEN